MSAWLPEVRDSSRAHSRQTDCLWAVACRDYLDRNMRNPNQAVSLYPLSALFIVLASVFGNVRLRQIFHSSSFTTGPQKSTAATEDVWKNLSSLAVCAVLGYHKPFVFLSSKHFHRSHREGKFRV
jgi:hypothetical protein